MDFRSTLNLPDPNFTIPMKADLPNLEPRIQARWEEIGIYHRIQEARLGAPTFVLHDGPPYTNSPIHIGTALNKILKDLVIKSRTMMGFRCPYVPGFDNHGLPIEQTVMRKFHEKKLSPSVVELRQACRTHAQEFIGVQTAQFKRLGVFGLWERPYATMDYRFEAEIVRVFKRLVEGGYIYKGLRPTLWSPTSRTALADTEIVYRDHVSKAIYVRFPVRKDPNRVLEKFPHLYTIIWTTTPWTIPANLAVAFHPTFEYAIVKVSGTGVSPVSLQGHPALDSGTPRQDAEDTHALEGHATHYLVLADLVPKLATELGWGEYEVVEKFDGITLEHVEFSHPIFDRPSLAVMAEYVTTEDGTGVVHTAPSHGRDDFYTGLKYNLPVPNTVDERGYLTDEAGEFAGTFYKDCDTKVVDRLQEVGALLKVSDYSHSYPYAERDEKPVIFRATEQWFLALDHKGLRGKMLSEIRNIPLEDYTTHDHPEAGTRGVSWVPENGFNRIDSMVRNRPDWCVSRQRPWGVGIPVFYGAKSRVPVLDPDAIEAIAILVETEGSDAWFVREPHEILPPGYVHPETGETEFVKETDVLDVWFDSGSTNIAVLEGNLYAEWEKHWPADLYLEGSDQHRGWFNASLIIGTALHGAAPYKQVVTHGFVDDEKGEKISKRKGNGVDPVDASNTFGADVLRYWVASVDYANDAPIGPNLLKTFGEHYRTVRNTLRFLLGSLQGYSPESAATVEMGDLDLWLIEQVDLLTSDTVEAYRRFEFSNVITGIHNFCARELSRFYVDASKDAMYCGPAEARASGQVACHYALLRILSLVAPILCHTAEETWAKIRENGLAPVGAPETVHALTFNEPSSERLAEIAESDREQRFGALLGVRGDVFAAFEKFKGTDDVKDSQEAIATITEGAEVLAVLRSFSTEELANLLKLSWVELAEGEPSVTFRRSEYLKCERSRLRRPDVAVVTVNGEEVALTQRDRMVLGV